MCVNFSTLSDNVCYLRKFVTSLLLIFDDIDMYNIIEKLVLINNYSEYSTRKVLS